MNLEAILSGVQDVTRQAGRMAREGFRHSEVVRSKPGGDLATDIDLGVNDLLVRELRDRYPSFGVLSEESDEIHADSEYTWVIDPIDGSKHFMRGVPLYAVSVALRRFSAPVLGVVHVPPTDEFFCSVIGQGATLDGKRIRCSPEADIGEALVCVELPSRHGGEDALAAALRRLEIIMLRCQRARVIGVTTLGLCYCACGGFDAYVNLGSYPNAVWDTAAGEAVAREAGCTITKKDGITIAAGRSLHDQLVEAVT